MDNAGPHRSSEIAELIDQHNNMLFTVPYQHFTNAIENYFSMLKARLHKKMGLTYEELKNDIKTSIGEIDIGKYENIIKGAYYRENYINKKKLSNRLRLPKNYL